MAISVCVRVALLSMTLSGALAETGFKLLTIPVNVTSWGMTLRDFSMAHRLDSLKQNLLGLVKFVKNVTVNCRVEGEECLPDVPSCCAYDEEDDEVIQCRPRNGSFFCTKLRQRNNSEEFARQRLEALEYGSMGVLGSHPWADSWEFESMSEAEREERQLAEEEKWKKNFKPSTNENFWIRSYKAARKGGKNFWHDLRKLKKLRQLKESFMDKLKKVTSKTVPSNKEKETENKSENLPEDKDTLEKDKGEVSTPEKQLDYPEEISRKADEENEKNSEETFIKFPDEMPKQEKKIDFKIDDIINDAMSIVDKKIKDKAKDYKEREKTAAQHYSVEEPYRPSEIEDTEDKLIKEINELKSLKNRRNKPEVEHRDSEPDIEELIRRQVAAILDEERRLEKLKKIDELRRIEDDMKQRGQ